MPTFDTCDKASVVPTSRPFYAHSAPGETAPSSHWQLLRDHLEQVAALAKELAEGTGMLDLPAAAETAGWLHDLGKYHDKWQHYLFASALGCGPTPIRHSIHGAVCAFQELEHDPIAIAIVGHHSGLPDWDCGTKIENSEEARSGVAKTLLDVMKGECSAFSPTPAALNFEDSDEGMRRLEFWTRMLFSTLIDADRLNAAGRRRADLPLDPARLLKTLREQSPPAKPGANRRLNDLRRQVFEECEAAGEHDQGFFELTVPTGGGKTRSVMAFALAHARKHDLRRVFIVIPYLSIIEQNAREYRKIFGDDMVLEHHSAVVPEDRKPLANEPYRSKTSAELATENWDAPIIVTTSVQFLETLLAASPRRCRRLHSVARSVIIFDEAQCLPSHILNPLMDVFRDLTSNCGCSIVFSTATQPAFRYSKDGLPHGLKENERKPILSHSLCDQLYRDLQRAKYVNETAQPWDWDELTTRLAKSPALCVLNTRRHAREVWEKLRETVEREHGEGAAVRHLSSSLCAEHRMDILGRKDNIRPGTIYQRLRDGLPCWVVSTQVIEAGVDIDFPRVFRALGPLDSIVQAGGRCNREGSLTDADGKPRQGEVMIFRPKDHAMPQGTYQVATGATCTLLSEIPLDDLVADPNIFSRYFSTLFRHCGSDPFDIQKARADQRFKTVAEKAKVIDDGGQAVIVPYRAAKQWIRRLRKRGAFSLPILRRLQRYSVNLQQSDFAAALSQGIVQPLLNNEAGGPFVLAEGYYDDDLGVDINGNTPE